MNLCPALVGYFRWKNSSRPGQVLAQNLSSDFPIARSCKQTLLAQSNKNSWNMATMRNECIYLRRRRNGDVKWARLIYVSGIWLKYDLSILTPSKHMLQPKRQASMGLRFFKGMTGFTMASDTPQRVAMTHSMMTCVFFMFLLKV